MKDDVRYRRKPAEYTVVERLFNQAGEPVVHLIAGDFDAIEVPWDEFRRDFEVVAEEQGGEPAEEERAGQAIPARYLLHCGSQGVAVCQGEGGGLLACRLYDGEPGLQRFSYTTSGWDAARARWIADGRPTS